METVLKTDIPDFVMKIIEELAAEAASLSIWLVGSRANGNANTTSDWDILVFSNEEPFYRKQRDRNIDVIWVGPSGNGLVEGRVTEFPFDNWEWRESYDQMATYQGRRFIDYPEGIRNASEPIYEIKENLAFCLWRQPGRSGRVKSRNPTFL